MLKTIKGGMPHNPESWLLSGEVCQMIVDRPPHVFAACCILVTNVNYIYCLYIFFRERTKGKIHHECRCKILSLFVELKSYFEQKKFTLIAVLNHPSIVPRVSRTKPMHPNTSRWGWFGGGPNNIISASRDVFFKMWGGTLCMLERISLKVGWYESTGYQRVPQIPGWWQFGRGWSRGQFFLEAKRSAFMIHQPAMCDQATTKEWDVRFTHVYIEFLVILYSKNTWLLHRSSNWLTRFQAWKKKHSRNLPTGSCLSLDIQSSRMWPMKMWGWLILCHPSIAQGWSNTVITSLIMIYWIILARGFI